MQRPFKDSDTFIRASRLPERYNYLYRGHMLKLHTVKVLTGNEAGVDIHVGECVVLSISWKKDIVYLAQLEAEPDCVSPPMLKGLGTFLLEFVIEYSRNILHAQGIKLKDYATVNCDGIKVNLATHYLFLHHKTWYERFGFQPKNKNLLNRDKRLSYSLLIDLSLTLRRQLQSLTGLSSQDTISDALVMLYDQGCSLYYKMLNHIAIDLGMTQYENELLGANYGSWLLLF